MAEIELVLGLMLVVAMLGIVARWLSVPYPIVLVIGGLLIGLVPNHPTVTLAPELVFLLFLPPLLYIAAFFTSIRDFKAEAKPILRLAVGLVLATTAGVAVIVHTVRPDLGWPLAFALGAIVSPPDAVAATSIFRKLSIPRGTVTVLEGESLLNDATGLVAFRFAVAAAVTGAFSILQTGMQLIFVSITGIAIGLAVGWVVARLRKKLQDPPVEITISLLTPYAAFLPADAIGASGVLATVACGLYLGRAAPRIMDAETRVQGRAVWDTLIFLLNGLVFVLLGLQMPLVISQLRESSVVEVVVLPALVCAGVVAIRFFWIFATDIRSLTSDPSGWRQSLVLSWAGMRGVVSLAAALSLPLTLASGEPLPARNLLIYITVWVILVTLVGQGLTLPKLLQFAQLRDDGSEEHEETYAREVATSAARERIDALADEWADHLPLIDTLRSQYEHRLSHLGEHSNDVDGQLGIANSDAEQELLEHRAIRHSVIEAQRDAVLQLRDEGQINDEVLRRVERELDLEELRMEA